MKTTEILFRLHNTLTRLITSPMIPDEQLARLEAAEEHLNNHRNAAAVGVSPPPGLAGSILAALRSALPPEKIARFVATLPERERLQLAALFAEPPVKRKCIIRR